MIPLSILDKKIKTLFFVAMSLHECERGHLTVWLLVFPLKQSNDTIDILSCL